MVSKNQNLKHEVKMKIVESLVAAGSTLAILGTIIATYVHKSSVPKRNSIGTKYHKMIINSIEVDYRNHIRMSKRAYFIMRNILLERGNITDTMGVSFDEQLVMFMYILSYNLKNRKIGHEFGHFGEIVSRHFNRVLNAVIGLHREFFKPPESNIPLEIARKKGTLFPYFKVMHIGHTYCFLLD
ncbi:hypothetical protein AMTRI_Chr08g165970 [Amborella trichopoda]